MIYMVNGKLRFSISEKSLQDNVKQVFDNAKYEKRKEAA